MASTWAMQVEGSPGQKLIKKMDLTKSALRKWNKLHFGFIKDWIHSLLGELDLVQQAPLTAMNKDFELSFKAAIQEQLIRE